MKFTPPELPQKPTLEQWRWWRSCFTEGLEINEITTDSHKLTYPKNHTGHELYELLKNETDFSKALSILDNRFGRQSRILYARHSLLSCTQQAGETINDFVGRLQILAHRCECKAVTADEHRNLLLSGALISGISSDVIWARLLELDDAKATLEDCTSIAAAIKMSLNYSRNFHSKGEDDRTCETALAATEPTNTDSSFCAAQQPASSRRFGQAKCFFCGRDRHARRYCPAKDNVS